jgi:small nuclear ribonucleoprotein (snRNP)-like protein
MSNTVTGVLKGYDQLLNLVLDEVEEQVQGTYIHTRATFPNPLIP